MLKLPTLLEEEALVSWLELSEGQEGCLKKVKEKVVVKMTPLPFTALEEFASMSDFQENRCHCCLLKS